MRVVTLDRIFDSTDVARLPHRDQIDGIDVRRMRWFGSKRYPIAPGQLLAIRDADLVHVHALDFAYDYLALTRPLHRRPMIFSTHGLFFHTPFASRAKELYFKTITKLGSFAYRAIAASSAQDEARFRTIRQRGVLAVENGVALDKFANLAARGTRNIIAFGRIAPNKRIDQLIEWFARLTHVQPDWTLTIAGKPMGVSLDALRAQAGQLGVADRVTFHEFPSDDELRALIARASVFACASEYEGFGLAAIEAAAAGLYLALSPIEPFRRSLTATGHGAIVDFADPTSPAAFIDAYAAGQANLPPPPQSLEARFGWQAVSEQFEHVYCCVTGRTRRLIDTVAIYPINASNATAHIAELLARSEPAWVAFANQHTINTAARDPVVRDMLAKSFVIPDGIAIDVASKLLYGRDFPENLNGTDYLPNLLQALPPQRLFLLGSKPGVAERAGQLIRAIAPQHAISGWHHGFADAQATQELIAQLRSKQPTLLLVGMGHPYQERWIAEHAADLPLVAMTVGAWFDFLSSHVPRAPLWMRRIRMEWCYRLYLEPKRMFSRYITGGFIFMGHVITQNLRGDRI
ncbi:alpha-1,3-mannosyltransferase [Sphingobium xenophagum]|uniref:Alpha-1,3-mannosyltransferase n=1 Tax=Sphingobium xenophagum TaxID=121428 RepID=A0A401J6B3_SPHXE|nr:alpha-1,3-mannosyltransferase [Sphingobium xenophagum]